MMVVAAFLLLLWIFLPKPSFWGIDNGVKFQGAEAFATKGSLNIPYFGQDFDPDGVFRPLVRPFSILGPKGQVPVFSPLFLVLAGIFYKLLGRIGPSILPLLGGWMLLAASWLMWIRHRRNRDGRLFLLMVGLGSPALFYSLTLWEYSIAMALVTISLAYISRGRTGLQEAPMWEPLAAGVLLAIATALRTEAVLWAPILLIFWSQTGRRSDAIWLFIGGLALGLGVFGGLNHLLTGNFLPLHLLTNNFGEGIRRSIRAFAITRAQNFYVVLIEGFKQNHYSVIGVLPLIAVVAWRRWRIERGYWYGLAFGLILVWLAYLAVSLSAQNQAGYMYNNGGMMWVTPFIVLGLFKLHGERRRFWYLIWAGSLLYIAVVAFTAPFVRGVHWGPRLVIMAVPPLMMIGATRAQRWWHRSPSSRSIIVLLAIMSIFNQFYSVHVLREAKEQNVRLTRWAVSAGAEAAVTNLWWLPGDLALLSAKHPWYVIRSKDPTEMQRLIQGLRSQGVLKFSFYELPPYLDDKSWWYYGTELREIDYMVGGAGGYKGLRRIWLRIIPVGGRR